MDALLSRGSCPGPPTVQGPPCVLVVDDEDILRTVLTRELRKRGFDVYSTGDGADAVEVYCRESTRIDLVLMDVNMPGMSGPDVLDAIRADDPDVRCCFMTADQHPTTRQALLARGALEVFGKPFESLTDLCASLRRLAAPTPEEVTRWTS